MDLLEDVRIQYVGSSIAYLWIKFCFFCFSWVKKNVKETYGGAEEVRNLMLKISLLHARKNSTFLNFVGKDCTNLFQNCN